MRPIIKKISRKPKKKMTMTGSRLKSLEIENIMLTWMELKKLIHMNGKNF